jgi:hypothetical protein
MGSGRWSTDTYAAAAAYRAATGADPFDYNARTHAGPHRAWTAHPDLDPFGVRVRESRDSDEHPTSLAIAVLFDVTGSMGYVPRRLQEKLPQLFGLLQRKGYVEHPQILFGAVGDAVTDRVPLQVGQFESDNRMDVQLGNIFLEGNGGGQMTESYQLAAYFMARHTSIDCFEKRGKRGYLFFIGDEMCYPAVRAAEVRRVIGGERAENISTEAIFAELRRAYDTYYILPEGASYVGNDRVLGHWRGLLGQHVIQLDCLDAVCETIALTIGLAEDAIDLDEGLDHLDEVGSDAGPSVSRALARLEASRSVVAVSAGPPDLGPTSSGLSSTVRL